jgi:flagellar basal-body rod protein FlgC
MSIFNTLRIAGSALTAQRLRMDIAAGNLANAETTRTAEGGPYVPRSAVFAPVAMGAGEGVEAAAVVASADPRIVYDPEHPDADENGYVAYPGVDVAAEMVDMMAAQRSYQIGVTIAQAAKQQALDAIELGR